jgi:hypothetical protein
VLICVDAVHSSSDVLTGQTRVRFIPGLPANEQFDGNKYRSSLRSASRKQGFHASAKPWCQAVVPSPRPARRLLPKHTCLDTLGLISVQIQPGSVEYKFMSRLTLRG